MFCGHLATVSTCRSEVLGLMNEVRAKRGTLKGIAMSVLVADAEAVMASRKVSDNKNIGLCKYVHVLSV